ncbi:MAG: phosphohydrolase [Treponemataceae bacterium]|nr:phosphohydrolase [Treponemataceae bacterium]
MGCSGSVRFFSKADRYLYRHPLFYTMAAPLVLSASFQRLRAIPHHDASIADHVITVAFWCFMIARLLGLRKHLPELIRGALLHDYFFYDWRISRPRNGKLHGFHHPQEARENAEADFGPLSPIEKDCIEKHMFPLTLRPPIYRESVLLCIIDKIVAFSEVLRMIKIKKRPTK